MDDKKISLRELIWLTFSFISSVSFIGSFAVISNSKDNSTIPGMGMGAHVIWILAIEGVITAICAFAFAKLSRIHSDNKNGGAYVYSRTAFGRLAGFAVASMQYVVLPFVISVQIMMLMRGFFEAPYIPTNTTFNIGKYLGSFHDLIFDLVGILIYGICASTVFFGIKIYKKLALTTGYIKWGTSLLLILAGLVLAIQHGKTNYAYWFSSSGSHLSLNGFMYTFTASFFYFTGFEQVITSTKNIENPQKNISIGLLVSMGIVTVMYVLILLIFFGAIDPITQFQQNMGIGTWQMFGKNWIIIVGSLIMFGSQLALKAQISMLNCFIGGTMIQPLADEGYIPEKYKTLNKDNVPLKAAKLNMIMAACTVFLWLIIPDIINGILTSKGYNPIPFSVAMMTSVTSVITIFVYSIVILAIFKFRKLINLKLWEFLAFGLVLIFLIIIFVYHYYSLIHDGLNPFIQYKLTQILPDGQTVNSIVSGFVGVIVELAFTLIIIIGSTLVYRLYYLPKYKLRLQKNPNIQKQLDEHFKIYDNVAINNELSSQLKVDSIIKNN